MVGVMGSTAGDEIRSVQARGADHVESCGPL